MDIFNIVREQMLLEQEYIEEAIPMSKKLLRALARIKAGKPGSAAIKQATAIKGRKIISTIKKPKVKKVLKMKPLKRSSLVPGSAAKPQHAIKKPIKRVRKSPTPEKSFLNF